MFYREIHKDAQHRLAAELRANGHDIAVEFRLDGCIFDVYDKTTGIGYEVLTAKFQKSAHEQDEAIVAKMLRYLLRVKELEFVVATADGEDLGYLHDMGIRHWHYSYGWMSGFDRRYFHKGAKASTVARRIIRAMQSIAPLREWAREKRRDHGALPEFERLNKRLGLPENFLIGMWRDWRLNWVWRLEKELPKWARKK